MIRRDVKIGEETDSTEGEEGSKAAGEKVQGAGSWGKKATSNVGKEQDDTKVSVNLSTLQQTSKQGRLL